MKKHAILATLAAALLMFAGNAMAQMPEGGMPMFEHMHELFHSLDLTPQQQESIKSIIEQCHAKNGATMHQVHDLHIQMMASAFSENFDPVAFRNLIEANKG